MNELRLNSIIGALKKIKAISKKPSLTAAFNEMHKGQKHKVHKDFQLLRNVYKELAEAVDIPLIAKVYKTRMLNEKDYFDQLDSMEDDF